MERFRIFKKKKIANVYYIGNLATQRVYGSENRESRGGETFGSGYRYW